eukprot:6281193-Alexandrium_andersonii.AAC.2
MASCQVKDAPRRDESYDEKTGCKCARKVRPMQTECARGQEPTPAKAPGPSAAASSNKEDSRGRARRGERDGA